MATAATQPSSLMGGGGRVIETCDSYVCMEAIAASANAAKFQAYAIDLHKCMWIALGIKHADLVVVGIQIARAAIGQVALSWFTAAEQHRITLLGRGCRGFTNNAFNHLLDQAIGPEEDFFCTAVEAKGLLDINITGIQAGAAAQGGDHSVDMSTLDQVLKGAAAPAVGQVCHVEDHRGPLAPDRFRDQVAPMRHKDPFGIELLNSFSAECCG